MIELKVKIQKANAPILKDIYKMAELKGLIQKIKNVNVNSGSSTTYIPGIGSTPIEVEAFINVVSKDKLIEEWETEIEHLQEEIEAFNAKTKI